MHVCLWGLIVKVVIFFLKFVRFRRLSESLARKLRTKAKQSLEDWENVKKGQLIANDGNRSK